MKNPEVTFLKIFSLSICLLITPQCTTDIDEETKRKIIELELTDKLNREYYYLLKDKNGIPNSNGLILMHSDQDSLFIRPELITTLDFTPNWERDSFPIEVLNFTNVRNLYLGMRSFKSMPKEITQLSKLESIDIQNSLFKHLPNNIGELKKLNRLILLNSDIEELPVSICELKNLKQLHLGGTKIKTLPNCLNELIQLEELVIFHEKDELSKQIIKQIESLKVSLPNCSIHIG